MMDPVVNSRGVFLTFNFQEPVNISFSVLPSDWLPICLLFFFLHKSFPLMFTGIAALQPTA